MCGCGGGSGGEEGGWCWVVLGFVHTSPAHNTQPAVSQWLGSAHSVYTIS